jgi:hypothetical protein
MTDERFCFQFHSRYTKNFCDRLKAHWYLISKKYGGTEIIISRRLLDPASLLNKLARNGNAYSAV